MNEQPLDLRRMIRAVLKRWVLVLLLVWGGCAAGFLIATQRPVVYTASASVLLPPSSVNSEGKATRNILTQVNIARNGNLLQRAGRAVNPPIGARRMRTLISVRALTNDILEVRAKAPSASEAALLADSVAKEYVAEATDASSKLSATAISGLVGQADRVEVRLRETKAEMDAATAKLNSLPPTSPERARQAAIVDGLRLQEVETARQLSSLSDKIAEARLQDELNREGTSLLSPAIRPSQPSGPPPVVFTLGGAVLGAIAALLLALIFDRRDGRIRMRSELANIVAAPVLASLSTPHRITARGCRLMLERWEPTPLQSWALRQALLRLRQEQGEPPRNIVVVGLPGDPAGPLMALQLAVFIASLRTKTTLAVPSAHPTAAKLRSACHRQSGAQQVRSYLTTSAQLAPVSEGHTAERVTVTFLIVDGDPNVFSGISRDAIVTLGVSSGYATADTLAAAAVACLDAGRPLAGVFVANADPSDPSSGDLTAVPVLQQAGLPPREVTAGSGAGGPDPDAQVVDAVEPEGGLVEVEAVDPDHTDDVHPSRGDGGDAASGNGHNGRVDPDAPAAPEAT